MGTSLSIESLNSHVKFIAKDVQKRGGIAIFVNKDLPASRWHKVFDYYIKCEVDRFAIEFAHLWHYNKKQEWEEGEKGELTENVITSHKLAKMPRVDWSHS